MASDAAEDFADEDAAVLLAQAREKSTKLLEHLIAEQARMEKNPPKIEPEALAEGRQAMANAIAAARRTLQAIESAIATAPDGPDLNADDPVRWN
jgi:hypothetical protein